MFCVSPSLQPCLRLQNSLTSPQRAAARENYRVSAKGTGCCEVWTHRYTRTQLILKWIATFARAPVHSIKSCHRFHARTCAASCRDVQVCDLGGRPLSRHQATQGSSSLRSGRTSGATRSQPRLHAVSAVSFLAAKHWTDPTNQDSVITGEEPFKLRRGS